MPVPLLWLAVGGVGGFLAAGKTREITTMIVVLVAAYFIVKKV